jgi:hypothetical protein
MIVGWSTKVDLSEVTASERRRERPSTQPGRYSFDDYWSEA